MKSAFATVLAVLPVAVFAASGGTAVTFATNDLTTVWGREVVKLDYDFLRSLNKEILDAALDGATRCLTKTKQGEQQ